MQITDDNAFDEYARKCGWCSDNHGSYRGEVWDWYAGATAGMVLMRQSPDRVAIVNVEGLELAELWSGRLSTTEEFDRILRSCACD